MSDMEERFWAKVEKSDGCWLWTGGLDRGGYGQFSIRKPTRTSLRPHRVAYELLVGPIPDGLPLDHLCRNRRCVNPDHLEPVTPLENSRRAKVLKTHCVNGHEYIPENIYTDPSGRRRCRICRRSQW